MSLALHEVAETLVPRRYQEEIFSRAQERNVIAALDTGSGKTYISTLLIKWIVTRDAGQGKICVFLVPKVALVDQQGDFIAKETGLRVSKRYGSTAIDMTDRRGWRSEIEDNDVLVMTGKCDSPLHRMICSYMLSGMLRSTDLLKYPYAFPLDYRQGTVVFMLCSLCHFRRRLVCLPGVYGKSQLDGRLDIHLGCRSGRLTLTLLHLPPL